MKQPLVMFALNPSFAGNTTSVVSKKKRGHFRKSEIGGVESSGG